MKEKIYNRKKTIQYAEKWAYGRNANDKSPSWTGVEFLNDFLINNRKEGPQAVETTIENMELGDIIQLSFDGFKYGHSLIIVNKKGNKIEDILIATHTFNAFNRKLSSYEFKKIKFLHITKVITY